jgi:hypothetical protein
MGRRRFVGEAAISKAYATFAGSPAPSSHQGRAPGRTKLAAGAPARAARDVCGGRVFVT